LFVCFLFVVFVCCFCFIALCCLISCPGREHYHEHLTLDFHFTHRDSFVSQGQIGSEGGSKFMANKKEKGIGRNKDRVMARDKREHADY
jgi:hypothetical protein